MSEENFGNQGLWQLLSITVTEGSSIKTEVQEIENSGCIVKTTTAMGAILTESLCFVPYVKVQTLYGPVPEGVTEFNPGDYPICGRTLINDLKFFSNVAGEPLTREGV
jgi:hypothetical protein